MSKIIAICNKCELPINDNEVFGITEEGKYVHYFCSETNIIVELKDDKNLPKKENNVIIKETE
jgi:hypothetical protein